MTEERVEFSLEHFVGTHIVGLPPVVVHVEVTGRTLVPRECRVSSYNYCVTGRHGELDRDRVTVARKPPPDPSSDGVPRSVVTSVS